MGEPQQKKLDFAILEVLREYSDAEHRLSQRDIMDILEREYHLHADRKSIKRNLTSLMEMGYDIGFKETLRQIPGKDGTPEDSYILSDFYLEREFTDAELRLLIDGLLFSKHIPYNQCKDLVEKLKGLSNRYFKSHVRFISTLPETTPENPELFYTIEILDEAIANRKQVTFTYNSFGTDKKLHPRRDEAGAVKRYIVNPYQMAATNGRYYLICNCENHDGITHFRLDRITNIRLLDTGAKPVKLAAPDGLNLPKHMAEHLYMFSGKSVPVAFRAKKEILNDIIDWFGRDVRFYDETEDTVCVRATVNWGAMRHWTLQYCRHVQILSPEELRETVAGDLIQAAERYQKCE